MTLESMIKKVNKGLVTGALCATLLAIPTFANAQTADAPAKKPAYGMRNDGNFSSISPYSFSEITTSADFLLERYDKRTAMAVLDALVYNNMSYVELAGTTESLMRKYLKTEGNKDDLGKLDLDVIYGIVKAYGAGSSSLDDLVGTAQLLETRFMKTPEFKPEQYSAGIAAILEAIGAGKEKADSITDRYFSYNGSLDRNDMIKATSISENPDEIISFGEYLMTEKGYDADVAGSVMYSFAIGKIEKEKLVEVMDNLLSRYDKETAKNLGRSYSYGNKNLSELEFQRNILSGRYDEDVLSKIVEIYGNKEPINWDGRYLCSNPSEKKLI